MLRSRSARITLLTGALAVAMSGCGSADDTDETATDAAEAGAAQSPTASVAAEGVAISMPDGPYVTPSPIEPSPARDESLEAKILYALKSKVAKQAGISIKTTAQCDPAIKSNADQKTTCTVTYEGLSVPFEVEINGGRTVASYRARPSKALLVKDGVHIAFAHYAEPYADLSSLRCSDDLPEKALVEVDGKTGYTCSYIRKDSSSGRRIEKDVVIEDDDIDFA